MRAKWTKFLVIGICLLLLGLLLPLAFGGHKGEECACLYSSNDTMEMLVDGDWDVNNPDAGTWGPINTIDPDDADDSHWGVRFPDLPWTFMYDSCADWVYGNNDWESPEQDDHQYYRLPFTVPDGECFTVQFQAYIDDGARFYIASPNFAISGAHIFYYHDPDVSISNHDPVEFSIADPIGAVPPMCLGPGEYTIYIDHWDTEPRVIYGLIFTAECEPCQCPCQCGEWEGPGGNETMQGDVKVTKTAYWLVEPGEPGGDELVTYIDCGETVTLGPPEGPGYTASVTVSSVMTCEPEGCAEPTYTYDVVAPNGSYVYDDEPGHSVTLDYIPVQGPGIYQVVLNATCAGVECPSCEIFVEFKEECQWTACGIINDVSSYPVNWQSGWSIPQQTVITFEECAGNETVYTLYGIPDLEADNNSSVTLSNYGDCQCARYCWVEENGKKIITKWESISSNDTCCVSCCPYCCDVDFSFIGSPVPDGGDGGPGGPPSLCPGEELTYLYELNNYSPYMLSYEFVNPSPSGYITFDPSSGDVDAGEQTTITVDYQMPGNPDGTCNQSSYTFTHTLNITISNTPVGDVQCAPIESSVLVNCHKCPECVPKMHYEQSPDEKGWDVYSCESGDLDGMIQAADDFQCSESGPVSCIRFWGSWEDDEVGLVTGFWVEIYSNNLEDEYSQPGQLLWRSFITDYTSQEIQTPVPEGWYDPYTDLHEGYNHNAYYQYDITDIEGPFYQEEGTIYWLSIYPVIDGGEVWGWKSSGDHWMDEACWSVHLLPDPQGPVSQYSDYVWDPLFEPPPAVQSLDLAFIIYGGEPTGTPSVSVNKTVSADGGATWVDEVEQYVCQNVQFKITVTNDGDVPLTNIDITDYLPDCLEYVDGPAKEVCLTTGPPIYNVPGDDTPSWHCTSGLDPGASIDIIYTAHVVESGVCKNQVAVDGEHNGETVSAANSATVIGIEEECQCEDWGALEITWTNEDQEPMSQFIDCQGGTGLTSLGGENITVNASNSISCTSACEILVPSAHWLVTGASSGYTESGIGLVATFIPAETESYLVEFYDVACVGEACEDCHINLRVSLSSQCQGGTEEWTVCWRCDKFSLPPETDNDPSQFLLDWIDVNYATRDGELLEHLRGTRDCDEDVGDRYWAHTFTGLEPPDGCHIVAATFEITVHNKEDDDHLKIGCISSANDTWEVNKRLNWTGWPGGGIPENSAGTITLDLSDVYEDGTTNLLNAIEANCFLDVAVDDDSMVDCARLTITYGS